MQPSQSLLSHIAEWWDERQAQHRPSTVQIVQSRRFSRWVPNRGSVIFTLLVVGLLLWAQTAGALPLPSHFNAPDAPSTGTIAYQGRLADAGGNPLTSTVNMEFRLYNAATGGTPLWSELWTGSNAVQVSDGLFNVMLGSLTPILQAIVTGNSSLWLGITAGTDDEMMPRVQLGSVPFAVQALTVPDGTITTRKVRASTYMARGGDLLTANGAPAWELRLMPPLSITIPANDLPVPTKALVLFDARCRPRADVSILQFEIALDGARQSYTDAYPPVNQMVAVSLHALVDLSPNVEHTISLLWNPAGSPSGTAECGDRSLTVVLLGQS